MRRGSVWQNVELKAAERLERCVESSYGRDLEWHTEELLLLLLLFRPQSHCVLQSREGVTSTLGSQFGWV